MKKFEIRRIGSVYGLPMVVRAADPMHAVEIALDVMADSRKIVACNGDTVMIQNGWGFLVREIND